MSAEAETRSNPTRRQVLLALLTGSLSLAALSRGGDAIFGENHTVPAAVPKPTNLEYFNPKANIRLVTEPGLLATHGIITLNPKIIEEATDRFRQAVILTHLIGLESSGIKSSPEELKAIIDNLAKDPRNQKLQSQISYNIMAFPNNRYLDSLALEERLAPALNRIYGENNNVRLMGMADDRHIRSDLPITLIFSSKRGHFPLRRLGIELTICDFNGGLGYIISNPSPDERTLGYQVAKVLPLAPFYGRATNVLFIDPDKTPFVSTPKAAVIDDLFAKSSRTLLFYKK